MSDYRYVAVANLAATFLPRNRELQARIVDDMLAMRDSKVVELTNAVADRDRAVERYMQENAELRGYIGRIRAILQEGYDCDRRQALDEWVVRVLELPIPGAGAKPQRPRYREFRTRILLCAECDRPNLCAIIAKHTAPCGKNELVSVESLEVKP